MPRVKGEHRPPLRLRARPSTMRPAERSPTLCWEKLRGRLHPRAPLKSLHRPLPLSLSLSLSWFLTATAALLRAEIPLDGRSLNQAPFHLQTPRPADSLALRQPFACLLIFHVMLVVLMIRRDVSILDQGRLWPSRCAKGSRGGGISLGTTYLGPRLFSRGFASPIADLRRWILDPRKAEPPSNSPFSSVRQSGRGCKQGTRACSPVAFPSESRCAFPAASSLGKSRPARGSSPGKKKARPFLGLSIQIYS